MGLWSRLLNAGRNKKEPHRDTDIYPKLRSLGQFYNQKSVMKQTPPNIRYFSRSVYVRRAINLLSNSISRQKWEIVPIEGVKVSNELKKQIEAVSNCLKHPNTDDSFATLMQQIIEDWATFGAGVIEQQMGGDPNRPLWLWPVDASSVQIYAGWEGGKNDTRYMQTLGYSNVGIISGRQLKNSEIIYIRCNPSTSTPYGYGPVEIAFNTINRLLTTAEFAGNLAGNAQPQNLLYTGRCTVDQLTAFRQYWKNEVEGQGSTPIFGGEDVPAAIKLHAGTDSALYLEFQTFLIREIATAFAISPQNLSIESDVNRSTAEVAEDRDWDQAIIPLASTIASYITREAIHSLLGFSQLEFRFTGLDRKDETETAKIYEIYYKNNLCTPNEQKLKLGLPIGDSQWDDMKFADMQIAISASRGIKEVDDPALFDEGETEEANQKTTIPKSKTTNKKNKKEDDDNDI